MKAKFNVRQVVAIADFPYAYGVVEHKEHRINKELSWWVYRVRYATHDAEYDFDNFNSVREFHELQLRALTKQEAGR